MIPYWLLFLLPALAALQERSASARTSSRQPLLAAAALLIAIMVGFRFQVGGDWGSYLRYLSRAELLSFSEVLGSSDPGYYFVNWLVAQTVGGIWLVNLICGVIFSWGLVALARQQPRPWLALVIAVPYLVIVVAMGYSRQAVAIGLAMLGLAALTRDRSVLKFVLWTALAATFHKSAVILVPMAALAVDRRRIWTAAWVGAASFVLYLLLLEESVDRLAYGYLEREYQSEGAAVRIAMNALPAAVFLAFRRYFPLAENEVRLWTVMSLTAILFVGLLFISPSSAAVDRVALYLVPLQLFVLSRLPDMFPPASPERKSLIVGVVVYAAAIQFVWLNFAVNARSWVPYQIYPLFGA